MLGHLVTLGIQHQSAGDHVLEGDGIEDHRGDGMQGKEPSTGLVDTLVDEVGGERLVLVYRLTVLERIVNLGVWHRTGVEPHVNEVALTLHPLSCRRDEEDIVHIRAVEVYLIIVLL